MYDISANKSFAQNYQTGRNEAQVFDTSTAENAIQYKIKQGEVDKAARAKKAEEARKRATDLMNNQVGEIDPADIPAFQKMSGDYRQRVLEAIKKDGGDLTPESEMALNQQWNNMTQMAGASKNVFEQKKAAAAKLNDASKFYREGEKLKTHEAIARPNINEKGEANFNFTGHPVDVFNIEKEVVEPMASHIISQVNANEVNRVKGIPVEQSAEYARQIGDNPAVAKEIYGQMEDKAVDGTYGDYISKVYGSPKNAAGAINPSYIADPKLREAKIAEVAASPDNLRQENNRDIAAYEFVDRFLLHGVSPEPVGNSGPGYYEKKPLVSGTFTKGKGGNDTFQFEYTNTQDNPYITIPDPANPKESIEVKPYEINYGGGVPKLKVLTKPSKNSLGLDVPGKEIQLDYNKVSDIMNNKFGIDNVYKLRDPNQTPSHVTIKRQDISGIKDQTKVDNEAKGIHTYHFVGSNGKTLSRDISSDEEADFLKAYPKAVKVK